MNGLIYVPQVSSDGLGRGAGQQGASGDATAQATVRFGQTLEGFGDQIMAATKQVQKITTENDVMQRQTNFITGVDQLNQKYQNDPDPSTATQRYGEELKALRESQLAGVDPTQRTWLDQTFIKHSISAVGNVRFEALKKQSDQYTANLDAQYQHLTARYASAKTDAERQAAQGELDTLLASGTSGGRISFKQAEGYRQSLTKTGDEAMALRSIGQNPGAAQSALADPARFAGLDPVRRQQLADQAKAASEEQRAAGIVQQARFNPAAAAFAAGRLTDPRQAELVFDRAIIPQESGGNAGAVSVQGALGVSQIMPATARMVAGKLGKTDIAGLSDAELRTRLTSDPKLARELGLAYFQDNLRTFNGNLAPTIASYHAGPGGAVARAHEQATAAFGDAYTPEQFLSFMPAGLKDGGGKATVDYVRDIYRRMGTATNAPSMSITASYRLTNAVGHVLDQEVARRDQVMNAATRLAGREADELAPILRDGYNPDPQRVAAVRSTLTLGVQRGNADAAEKLRSFDEALAIAPIVQEMYRRKPEQIEADLAAARQHMASNIVTPEFRRNVELMDKVSGEIAKGRKDAPIALLERQGITPATPVNVGVDLNDPNQLNQFRQQIAARSVASDKAEQLYASRQFFRQEEQAGMKQRFAEMGDNDKFRLLRELGDTVSPASYRAAVTELTGGDGHAATAGMFMRKNPELARQIMTGSAYLEQPGVKPKIDDLKKGIEGAFGGDMFPPGVQKDLIGAALAVYAAERGKNGALYDAQDVTGLQGAVEKVIGKVEKLNGRRVPIPADISASAAREAFYGLDQKTLDAMGGASLDVVTIRRYGQLQPVDVGGGKFTVSIKGPDGALRPVMAGDGKSVLELDLRDLAVKTVQFRAANYRAAAERRYENIRREGARMSGDAP